MYKKAINYLRGDVLLAVESAYPERIVNLCSAHGIPFWDVQWISGIRFTVHTTRQGERDLRRAAECTDAVIERLRQRGAPLLAGRLRRRYALLTSAAVFLLLLLGSNLFIWDLEVEGNETVPAEQILRALERHGIGVGTIGMNLDQEQLRNHVLLEVPDLSWLAVNVRGCVAHVQVVERVRPPEIVEPGARTNVVSAADGLVVRVEALEGRAEVAEGSTVTRGQLLISGVREGGGGSVRLIHGMGSVWARTWHELSVSVPLCVEEKGEVVRRHIQLSVVFGKHRIKLYGKGSVTPSACDKIIQYKPWTLPGGFRLPVTLVEEQYTEYRLTSVERAPELARQEGEAALRSALTELLGSDGSVEATRFASAQQGQRLLVTLKAECMEQIGVSVPLGQAQ